MGLFPNIGRMIGVKVSPKGVSIGAPKLDFNSLLTAASLLGGGANPFDFAKWGLGNVMKNTGLSALTGGGFDFKNLGVMGSPESNLLATFMGGGNGGGQTMGSNGFSLGQYPQQSINALASIIMPALIAKAKENEKLRPQREQTRMNAINSLTPNAVASNAMAVGNSSAEAIRAAAEQSAARAAASGMAPSYVESIRRDADVQSVMGRNALLANAQDPTQTAQRDQQRLALLSDNELQSEIAQLSALTNQAFNIRQTSQANKMNAVGPMDYALQFLADSAGRDDWLGNWLQGRLKQPGQSGPATQRPGGYPTPNISGFSPTLRYDPYATSSGQYNPLARMSAPGLSFGGW